MQNTQVLGIRICYKSKHAKKEKERSRQKEVKRRDRCKVEGQETGRTDVIAQYQVTLNSTS
jgi:hypothetical protein